MYKKNKIKTLRKKQQHSEYVPSAWLYYLGIVKIQQNKEISYDDIICINFKYNRWNPLTWIYLLIIMLKFLLIGICKGYMEYAREVFNREHISYFIDPE